MTASPDTPPQFASRGTSAELESAQFAGTQPSGTARLLRRTDLLAQGFSDNHIRRAIREGTLTAVSPGVYLREPDAQTLDAAARHRAMVDALVPRLSGEPVVSHISAAIVHGLPFVHSELPPVHVTRGGGRKSRRSTGVLAHRTALRPDEVVTLGGLAVTTVARTIVDCALLLPFGNAVALADAALHRRQVTRAALAEQVRGHARVPGVRGAAAVVDFADERSLGAGESYSRVVLTRAGLPPSDLRVRVWDRDGKQLGSASFGYAGQRVLGEFDGPAETSGPAGGAGDRDRDERLRDAGWQVLRWTWDDLRSPTALVARLAAALGVPVPALPDAPAGSLLGGGDLHLRGI